MPISNEQIIAVLRPFASIKISELSKVHDVVFPKVSAYAVREARVLMEALMALPPSESAPEFKASQNTAESDPSVMPDCAGADTDLGEASSLTTER